MSMLTGLKVLSLVCKCVFYRPEHNAKRGPLELNFKVLEMEKLKKPVLKEYMKKLDLLSSYHVDGH